MEGVSENVFFIILCPHVTQVITHTDDLPTWLLVETTPVGVLCFHNDSKDDLESGEKGGRVGARQM